MRDVSARGGTITSLGSTILIKRGLAGIEFALHFFFFLHNPLMGVDNYWGSIYSVRQRLAIKKLAKGLCRGVSNFIISN